MTSERPLGIHQITAMEASPVDLVSIASELGCDEVCVFTHLPKLQPGDAPAGDPGFPTVTPETKSAMQLRLAETGVRVANIEFFSLTPWMDFDAYRQGLELGAELGARCAVTHVLDPDPQRALENLGRLGEMAGSFGLQLAIEFMAASPDCGSIGAAAELAQMVGRHNIGIAIDMLHLVRSGGTPDDIRQVPAELIRYAQVCDGAHNRVTADYMDEALTARMVPGQGCFPISEILAALPPTLPLDIEIPRLTEQQAGVVALDRVREAVIATRRLL